eukprot:gene18068-55592_t
MGNRLRVRRRRLPQLQRMESAQASVMQRLDAVEQRQAPVSRAPPQPVPSLAAAVGALNPAAFGDVGPGVAVGGKGREAPTSFAPDPERVRPRLHEV